MSEHLLSKSSFIKGLQCDKQLYLYKYHYDLRDEISEAQQAVFARGWDVGNLAREIFPGGIDCSPSTPLEYKKSILLTNEQLSKGTRILYEPYFIYDGVMVAADILVKKNGRWKLYEVKSSTSISEVYLYDVALQYYVIKNFGIDIKEVSIVYLNNQYVRKGDLDLNQLFTVESVKDQILELQDFIKNEIDRLKKVLRKKVMPDIDISPTCFDPYDCAFLGQCWNHIPDYSVFNISKLKTEKKFELYDSGIINIEDVPEDYQLSYGQRLQVDCHIEGNSVIDKDGIKEFQSGITYPLYYMDFETMMPAVPLFDRSRPYQQIPFQYSVHYQKNKNSKPVHFEFLAEEKKEPRIPFIENLLCVIGDEGTVLVYNQSFEISRLNEIAYDFPKYKKQIDKLIERIYDLMIPFQKKYYYKPEMQGSYSIKKVLPALVPELGYEELEIKEGGTASSAFESLQFETDQNKINEIRKQLLEYCKMDTWAMVEIFSILERL